MSAHRWYLTTRGRFARVVRLTYPSVGEKRPASGTPEHVPTCLIQTLEGGQPWRVPARDLIRG